MTEAAYIIGGALVLSAALAFFIPIQRPPSAFEMMLSYEVARARREGLIK